MRQWIRALGGVGCAGALAFGVAASGQVTPGDAAPALCIVRKLDPGLTLPTDTQALSAWVTVKQPMYAYINGDGTASGTDLGHVALRVVQDGTLLAGSGDVSGTGRLDAQVRGGTYLVPGRQYRFVLTPELRDVKLLSLQLRVGTADCR